MLTLSADDYVLQMWSLLLLPRVYDPEHVIDGHSMRPTRAATRYRDLFRLTEW